jgi:hypothetical protein
MATTAATHAARMAGSNHLYAVIADGGRQYRVMEGQEFEIDFRHLPTGSEVVFDNVLAVSEAGTLKMGAPLVKGAKVCTSQKLPPPHRSPIAVDEGADHEHRVVSFALAPVAQPGSGLRVPRRRTFAAPILGSAHSDLAALRHPCLRLPAKPATGHAEPRASRIL